MKRQIHLKTVTCPVCGKTFQTRYNKTCSLSCGRKLQHQKQLATIQDEAARRHAGCVIQRDVYDTNLNIIKSTVKHHDWLHSCRKLKLKQIAWMLNDYLATAGINKQWKEIYIKGLYGELIRIRGHRLSTFSAGDVFEYVDYWYSKCISKEIQDNIRKITIICNDGSVAELWKHLTVSED